MKEQWKSLAAFLTMNRRPEKRERFLPAEVISEILSWLPVKSVLKFRSVCKLWHSITKDPEFIHTHMMRSTQQYIWDVQDPKSIYAFYQGLVVEGRTCSFSYLRLRNPSTNRFLDDAYYPSFVVPCYVSRTRTLKIILPCRSRLNNNGSFKIITAGVEGAWRTLDVPFTCKLTLRESLTVLVDGVYFIGVELQDDPQKVGLHLLCLEADSEKLWTISGPNYDDLGFPPRLLNWAGKPALATRFLLLEGDRELRVWVLEDYRKQVWVEQKITIDFPCDSLMGYYVPYQFSENQLWIHTLFHEDDELLMYDVVSKVLTRIDAPAVTGKKLRGLATLIESKGMKPYVSKKKRTCLDAGLVVALAPKYNGVVWVDRHKNKSGD